MQGSINCNSNLLNMIINGVSNSQFNCQKFSISSKQNLRSFWNLICFSCRNDLAVYGAWLQINTVHNSVILYQQYFFSTVDKWCLLSHYYLTGYNTSTHANENDWTLVNGQITWIYMNKYAVKSFAMFLNMPQMSQTRVKQSMIHSQFLFSC